MALDENTVRLAQGKNLATVVTLMPNGRAQRAGWQYRRFGRNRIS